MLHLPVREQLSKVSVESKAIRDMLRDLLAVPCEHHCPADSQFPKFPYGFGTVVLDLVVDDDVSGIDAVYRYVNDGPDIVGATVPGGSDVFHQPGIADADSLVADAGADPHSCQFLDVADAAAVGSFFREGVP